MSKNLNEIANELTEKEGLGVSLSVGQVREIIALLGIRWRSMSEEEAKAEFDAIVERAGLHSDHK